MTFTFKEEDLIGDCASGVELREAVEALSRANDKKGAGLDDARKVIVPSDATMRKSASVDAFQ